MLHSNFVAFILNQMVIDIWVPSGALVLGWFGRKNHRTFHFTCQISFETDYSPLKPLCVQVENSGQ